MPWEKYLTRKLNYYSLISILTLGLAILSYIIIGDYHFITELAVVLCIFPAVIFFNLRFNYVYALYLFYLNASLIVFLLLFKMGQGSLVYLFFFPLTISLLTLLNRKEMNIHIRILMGMIFSLLLANLIGIRFGWFQVMLSPDELKWVRINNIFFSVFITLLFSMTLSRQNAMQENELLSLLEEKEILLAEVHHRVKNNMAIISSLLNLKKESCSSDETKKVLEDCKNRIYSMALIHKNIYYNKSFKNINFQEYITELAQELIGISAEKDIIKFTVNAIDCNLGIDEAIPCGFIINELLTNSLKYAIVKSQILAITITMKRTGKEVCLKYSDNGYGFSFDNAKSTSSLGMTLIDLLCQQLEAEYSFKNESGSVFDMRFNLPAHA
ncbi:MAG: sensor histidine kinase [Bacteroidia bacterium]